MRRAVVPFAAILGCVMLATRILGCDPSTAAAVVKDTDGDGLSDTDERSIYGTSPTMADTDGDGFSDQTEIVGNAFDPVSSPLRFNPRVADVPMLEVEIATIPWVTLNLTDINGETRTIEVDQTYENSWEESVGWSQMESQGITEGISETVSEQVAVSNQVAVQVPLGGARAGRDVVDAGDAGPPNDGGIRPPPIRDAGLPPGGATEDGDPVTVTLTSGITNTVGQSTTVEQTRSAEIAVTFSAEQSRGYRRAVTFAEAYSQTHEIQASGATLEVMAFLRNRSNLAFQISNLFISSSVVTGDGSELPLGNLEISSTLSNFQAFSMAPGQEIGPVAFFKNDLTLEQAIVSLQDVRAIRLRIGAYELRDHNARPYAFDVPNIRARTASVNVDYAGLHPPEWYMVATNLDPARPGVSVYRAVAEILRIPFECSPDGGRVSVRGIGVGDPDAGAPAGRWCIFHRHRSEGEDQTVPYCSDVPSFDCNAIELRAGDLVRLSWIPE